MLPQTTHTSPPLSPTPGIPTGLHQPRTRRRPNLPSAVAHTSALALLILAGGALMASQPAAASCGHENTDKTLARVAGGDITHADLQEMVGTQLQQLAQQRHELLSGALERVVENRLLELEAKRQESTAQALVAKEVGNTTISEEEIDAWYSANQARIRQPKEQVADQIRSFLEQQQAEQARQRLVAGLEERYPVERLLTPYRVDAEVGSAPVRGVGKAPVTLLVFSDFECPFCQRLVPAVEQVEKRFGADLEVAFRHFPLNAIHPAAQKAAEAAACADAQDKFWPMHDALFAEGRDLSPSAMKLQARQLGLDGERFDTCLDSGESAEIVAKDMEAARALGVSSTPSIFINGRPVALLRGRPTADQIGDVVENELTRLRAGESATHESGR